MVPFCKILNHFQKLTNRYENYTNRLHRKSEVDFSFIKLVTLFLPQDSMWQNL